MTLYICRHGQTEANASGLLLGRADPDLNEMGRIQSAAIAAAVPTPARVVSSPLQRCRQTAEAFGQHIEVDERLIELDYGEFDLRKVAEISDETWTAWRDDADFRPPGGESLHELGTRVAACLEDLGSSAVDAEVVVVTHVSPIKAAIAWALGCSIAVSWRCFVSQASISEIAIGREGPMLRLFNGVGHLE